MSDSNVRIVDTPRGKTLVATNDLTAGTRIFTESSPLVRLPRGLLVLPGSTATAQTPLQRATAKEMLILSLAQSSAEQKRKFALLSNAWKGDSGGGLNVMLLVFLTNAVKIDEESDAVFELVSVSFDYFDRVQLLISGGQRMNHSCMPNACYYIHQERKEVTKGLSVYAAVDIKAGDEIMISYLDPLLPSTDRQRILKAAYNFDCTCATCSLSPELLQESDARRSAVLLYKEHLREWQADTREAQEIIKEARAILGNGGIIETEKLESERERESENERARSVLMKHIPQLYRLDTPSLALEVRLPEVRLSKGYV